MSDDTFGDDWKPGVQLNPLYGYEELRDIVDPVTGRMIGIHGITGMTIEEASRTAAVWWDQKGRVNMPDYGKSDQYLNDYGMKSGILLGLPWARLNRGERIRVVKVWHQQIGIPKHGMGVTTQKDYDNALKSIQKENEIRQFNLAGIFGPPDGETRH